MNRPHDPAPVDLASQSVAGEEDPGASADIAMSPGRSDQPAGGGADQVRTPQAPMAPGDEAPPGTPGTGEDVCPKCGGSGKLASGTCPSCQGTGKVTVGIGGGVIDATALPALQVAQTRGGRLGYIVSGQGEPRIVLVNGAGMSLEGWAPLYPAIESLGTVFAYNRFGIKGSDAPARAQTGAVVVSTLRELLRYAGIEPPYVLLAHSLGCVYAQLFARLHPEDARALLLVEPTPLDDPRSLAGHAGQFAQGTSKALSLPQEMIEENLQSELDCLANTLRELDAAPPLPDVPRTVLQGSGHFPQLTQPAVVLEALARVAAVAGA